MLNDALFLYGQWKLDAFTITTKDGEIRQWGRSPIGTLRYLENGSMEVAIYANSDIAACKMNPTSDVLEYSGTFKLISPRLIEHDVTQASNKDRIGKSFTRELIKESDEKISLVSSGEFGKATLSWKKRG